MTNNFLNSKRRFFATFLAISLIAFFGFAFLVGFAPMANAETIVKDSGDFKFSFDYGITSHTDGTSLGYLFNGAPTFSMSFPSFANNCITLPLEKVYENEDYFAINYINNSLSSYVSFNCSVDSVFRFPKSNVTSNFVTFSVPYNSTYDFFLLIYNQDSNFDSGYYRINDVLLDSLTSNYRKYVLAVSSSKSADEYFTENQDGTYTAFFSNGSSNSPKFSMFIDINSRSPASVPFVLYTFSLSAGTYTLRGTTSNSVNSYIAAMWTSHYDSTDYTLGYNDGYDSGYNSGYGDGQSAGYSSGYDSGFVAGKTNADNTVTSTSASYSAGYQKGVESAGNFSFMSLISAVIDAPIRAFFGYTENGVTHPGLFSFNILGYDMSALVLSMFSACVIIMIIKICLGGK